MKKFILFVVVSLSMSIFALSQNSEQKNNSEGHINPLIQYGALGVIVVAMFWYILFLHKERKQERAEYNAMIQKQFDKSNINDEKAVQATKEFSNILTGLKTLIELDITTKKKES